MQRQDRNEMPYLTRIVILSLIFLTGCIRNPAKPSSITANESEYLSHRITYSGETLGVIALWYAGDSSLWRSFYIPATSGTIRKLKRGDEILIPTKLVVRHEPLSREFVHHHQPSTAAKEKKPVIHSAPRTVSIDNEETIIRDSFPMELAPLEVEPFEEKPNSSLELEKVFIDRMVR